MSLMQPVRGTHDLLPEEKRLYNFVIQKVQQLAANYGFQAIETPILEHTEVFQKTLGEASDIVNKEMYSFKDRGDTSLTLRPEGTAPIARCFISNNMARQIPLKLFYAGPMFRYERPQKGRTRQFHQMGVEFIGLPDPIADVEVMALAHRIMVELGLASRVQLNINSVGDPESRTQYKKLLVEFLNDHVKSLSEKSQHRLKGNPLRILDSKDPNDVEICKEAPKIEQSLNAVSKDIYEEILSSLDQLEIPYIKNPCLVRGLDYYAHGVFEFRTQELGAQDALLSGGRYDQLISQMGGPDTPGVGWGAGTERLSLLVNSAPPAPRPLYIIPVGEAAQKKVLPLLIQLRNSGLFVETSHSGNLGKRMKKAHKAQAWGTLILGEQEVTQKTVKFKNLDSGEETSVPLKEIEDFVLKAFPPLQSS